MLVVRPGMFGHSLPWWSSHRGNLLHFLGSSIGFVRLRRSQSSWRQNISNRILDRCDIALFFDGLLLSNFFLMVESLSLDSGWPLERHLLFISHWGVWLGELGLKRWQWWLVRWRLLILFLRRFLKSCWSFVSLKFHRGLFTSGRFWRNFRFILNFYRSHIFSLSGNWFHLLLGIWKLAFLRLGRSLFCMTLALRRLRLPSEWGLPGRWALRSLWRFRALFALSILRFLIKGNLLCHHVGLEHSWLSHVHHRSLELVVSLHLLHLILRCGLLLKRVQLHLKVSNLSASVWLRESRISHLRVHLRHMLHLLHLLHWLHHRHLHAERVHVHHLRLHVLILRPHCLRSCHKSWLLILKKLLALSRVHHLCINHSRIGFGLGWHCSLVFVLGIWINLLSILDRVMLVTIQIVLILCSSLLGGWVLVWTSWLTVRLLKCWSCSFLQQLLAWVDIQGSRWVSVVH